MKPFTAFLQNLLIIFFLHKLVTVDAKVSRKWLEIDKELFIVESKDNYTWQQASAECKKEQSNLIIPKGDYDYAKLKEAIKHNFKQNHPSFWTSGQVKFVGLFEQIGLGKRKENRQRCSKFDNSSAFKLLLENCQKQLGFICEKPLLKEFSLFITEKMNYLVQPKREYTCQQANKYCDQHNMSLMGLSDHDNNQLLRNYIFNNYGSNVSFWFSSNHEIQNNCVTHNRDQNITDNHKDELKLGFICQLSQLKTSTMSMRHMIFLIFLATVASLAIITFILINCCFYRAIENSHLLFEEYSIGEELKVTEIK